MQGYDGISYVAVLLVGRSIIITNCIMSYFSNRGDHFRPDYGKLSVLTALFPNAPIAALTATATTGDRQTISNTLCLRNPKRVIGNLNRPNIFFAKVFREGIDNESYVKILQPISTSLLEQGTGYPLTLIYLPYRGVEGHISFLKAFLKKNNMTQKRDL